MADTAQMDASISNPRPATPPSFNVELKKTKVIWAQTALAAPLTWTETMMDLVAFRTMVDGRTPEDGPMALIPDEHLPLIGKLVHESDKDLKAITAEIQATLSPDGTLPTKAVSAAVAQVGQRVNYGIDGGLKDFCVWRWEVDNLDYIPTRLRETMTKRREDREKGRAVLSALYNALSTKEKAAVLTKAKQKKLDTSSGGKENIPEPAPTVSTVPPTIDLTTPELPPVQPVVESDAAKHKVKPLAPLEAKPKEKEAKPKKSAAKAAKESGANAPGKSNLLGYFKSKPAAASSSKTDVVMEDAKPEPAKPTFDEIFLPFRVKKGTALAPINYFDQEVIVLDHVGPGSRKRTKSISKDMAFLETFKASLPSSSKPRATTYARLHSSAPPLKTTNRLSVRDLVDQLNDATMAGDVNGAKALISTLSDRKKLPLRWFHFYENTRPMWVGTWTKAARNVGPRTPFGKEDGVDYEYDSGEDWAEEEEEGEEMEDTATLDGEDEEEDEDDNRDWIVDDDEDELEQEDDSLVLSLDEVGSGVITLPSSKGKRKADGLHGWPAKSGNKRRKLVPLKPDCKGPFWESKIGHSHVPTWSRYAIRVLNQVPLQIDPLVTYSDGHTPDKVKAADGFAIPALPDRLLGSSRAGSPALGSLAKRPSGSSNAKPVALLPDNLMQKMAGLVLEAPSGTTQVLMVDQVYQALKGEGAKRNGVEATLKTVFEKVKGQKKWVVREEYKGSVGAAAVSGSS